jgi:hypothetical protein
MILMQAGHGNIAVIVDGAIPADFQQLPHGVASGPVVGGDGNWAAGESQSGWCIISLVWIRAGTPWHICGSGQSARSALAVEFQAQQRQRGSASV